MMLALQIHMLQATKPLLPAILFFGCSAVFAYSEVSLTGAVAFSWLGAVLLLNTIANRLPFARTIHWIHAMSFELPVFLVMLLLRFMPGVDSVRGNGRPILLVHGYMNHGSIWRLFKKRLENLGFGPIYVIHLGHPFRSIRFYALKVKERAEQIAKETKRKDLILIGHSMGGLVSSWYAGELAPKHTVTDVITIGSPLFGTPVAYLGLGPNAREMEPNAPFLQELHASISRNKQIRFYHLATRCDQLVIPGTSAIIARNEYFIIDDLGHASLLYSHRVVDRIARWIAGAYTNCQK